MSDGKGQGNGRGRSIRTTRRRRGSIASGPVIAPCPTAPRHPPHPRTSARAAGAGRLVRTRGARGHRRRRGRRGLLCQGSLATDGALRLFLLAAANAAHGRLAIAAGSARYALTFRRGNVEHAASVAPEDDLGRFLVRRVALSPEQLVRAEGARAAAGGELVGALLSERLVAPADIAALLTDHGASLVGRALAVEAGSWSTGVAPPPSAFPLGNPYAMACAAVRAVDAAGAERRLGARAHRAASRVVARVRVEELRLAPQEARLVGLFDGRSPAEIAAAQPADAATILRVALLLAEAELLAFGEVRATSVTASPTASPSVSHGAGHPERSAAGGGAGVERRRFDGGAKSKDERDDRERCPPRRVASATPPHRHPHGSTQPEPRPCSAGSTARTTSRSSA